jgi:hypothetical protein
MQFVLKVSLTGKPKCWCLRGPGHRQARVFRDDPVGAAGAPVDGAEVLAAWPRASIFLLALFRGTLVALASRADPVPTKLGNSTIAVSVATLILRANQIRCRQVSRTLKIRSTNRLPRSLSVPPLPVRHRTACLSARSAALFVGSTRSCHKKVHSLDSLAAKLRHVAAVRGQPQTAPRVSASRTSARSPLM